MPNRSENSGILAKIKPKGDDLVREESQRRSSPSLAAANYRSSLGRWGVVLFLVVLFALFSVLQPDLFFTLDNVRVMIIGQATTLLLAMAVIVPLRAGDFDLSVASVMVVTGCLVSFLIAHGVPGALACLLAVLVGPTVGLVNGILVVRCGIDSFIITLGMVTIGFGAATAISGGTIVSTLPPDLIKFAAYQLWGLPSPVWIGLTTRPWRMALALTLIRTTRPPITARTF